MCIYHVPIFYVGIMCNYTSCLYVHICIYIYIYIACIHIHIYISIYTVHNNIIFKWWMFIAKFINLPSGASLIKISSSNSVYRASNKENQLKITLLRVIPKTATLDFMSA